MKNLTIEGFKVLTTLDEQRTFIRCCENEGLNLSEPQDEKQILNNIEMELSGFIIPFIENYVAGATAKDFYFENRRGYKNSSLEPFHYRESKKELIMIYTGAQGGGEYEVRIQK